jgi:tRNA U34 5-carboxymethylaminomethyl modifying GTPase MnmE/TrmE
MNNKNSGYITVIAIVGHPNAGKSSVLATLTENDQIPISPEPGTTIANQNHYLELDGVPAIELIDTPGFQHHQDILDWFKSNNFNNKKDRLEEFLAHYKNDTSFKQDCQIIKAIYSSNLLVYIVDDTKPIRRADINEMKILSLTGSSRMALINSQNSVKKYQLDWQDALRTKFSTVIREFNAHSAWFPERVKLFNAIREIDVQYLDLIDQYINGIHMKWDSRLNESANIISGMLTEVLQERVETKIRDLNYNAKKRKKDELDKKFQKKIKNHVDHAESKIRLQYMHKEWSQNLKRDSYLGKNIFSREVNEALGLNQKQLAIVSSATGAAIGGIIDASLGGASFLVGTLLGTGIGATVGYFSHTKLIHVSKVHPIRGAFLSHNIIEAHIKKDPDIVAKFMDWALLYCFEAMRWSHAKSQSNESKYEGTFTHKFSNDKLKIITNFTKRFHQKQVELGENIHELVDMKKLLLETLVKISNGELKPTKKI